MKRNWTKADVSTLLELRGQGMSVGDIAIRLNRTLESVDAKLYHLQKGPPPVPQSSFPLWDKPLKSEGDALILSDVEAPFQHSEFINRCLDLADKWGIRDLHLAGDLLHYDNLSAWGSEWVQDKEDLVDGVLEIVMSVVQEKAKKDMLSEAKQRLIDAGMLSDDSLSSELAEARAMFRSFGGFENIYVAIGNHDDRYLRTIERALEPRELLHQIDRHNDDRWHIAPYYYTLIETEQGIFRATHPRNSAKNAAIDLAGKYHQHIVMGHSHRWSINRDKSGEYWAIQTGCCVDEKRLAYVMQRDNAGDAHVLGATIIRGGYPFVLCPETPWDIMKRM